MEGDLCKNKLGKETCNKVSDTLKIKKLLQLSTFPTITRLLGNDAKESNVERIKYLN